MYPKLVTAKKKLKGGRIFFLNQIPLFLFPLYYSCLFISPTFFFIVLTLKLEHSGQIIFSIIFCIHVYPRKNKKQLDLKPYHILIFIAFTFSIK